MGNVGQFTKGGIPWNKGKEGLQKAWNLGIPHSESTRKKMKLYHKGTTGKKWAEEHKDKTSRSLLGHTVSKETREKISKSRRGKRKGHECHLWKGGITPMNQIIRSSVEYKLWRKSIFERDKYTCIWCGLKSGHGKAIILHADHIKPFSLFPELRFTIDNGRTLCINCHKKTSTYSGKIKNYGKD